jgi:hypothetical protein
VNNYLTFLYFNCSKKSTNIISVFSVVKKILEVVLGIPYLFLVEFAVR